MNKVVLLTLLLLTQTLAQQAVLSQSGSAAAEIVSEESTNAAILPSPLSASDTDIATTSCISADGLAPTSCMTADAGISTGSLSLVSSPPMPADWSFLSQCSLGDNSKWVSPTGDFKLRPIGYVSSYTVTFYTDCPQSGVTLTFAGTGRSYVQLNGEWVLTFAYPYPSNKPHQLVLKAPQLKCGENTLKIYVYNAWWASPSALIYNIDQNTTGCYNCDNLGVTFYNKQTCQCECASEAAECSNQLQQWTDYPSCGCTCSKTLLCAVNKFFNRKSCTCDCQPKYCPKGYVQDPTTCACRKQVYCLRVELCIIGYYWDQFLCQCLPKCPLIKRCAEGQTFNYDTCDCECSSVAKCISPLSWNPDTCACQCPLVAMCRQSFTWNSLTCKCECQLFCIATMTLDEQNCKCVPISYPVPIDPLPIDPVDPIEPIDPIHPIDPIYPYPIDPIEPIHPIDPIYPIDPIEPEPVPIDPCPIQPIPYPLPPILIQPVLTATTDPVLDSSPTMSGAC